MPTDAELAQNIAERISVEIADKLSEPTDASTREMALQDACEATHATLTRLGAKDVEFAPPGDDHAVWVSFLMPPRRWQMVLDVVYEEDDGEPA